MAQNGPKWAKMGLKWPKNGSKWVQNGSKMGEYPKMGLKWPKNGPTGPFWAILGVFGAFSGHLGLLDGILDQYAAAGTSHAHNCAS